MNSSVQRFTLDMHSAQSQISIPVMLGDTGRTLRISLSDGSNQYAIADGCLAKISIKTPTETHIEEFCTIEDNTTIVYPFSEYTCETEGIHECDVTLYGLDGKVITSPRFTMVVSERVINSDYVVISTDDRTAVDAMLAKEAERQYAEKGRVSAESARAEAEAFRAESETARVANEMERQAKAEEFLAAFEETQEVCDGLTSRVNRNSKEIANLKAMVAPELFLTDATTAYQKTVPATALTYASIDKIGGVAKKSANLFNIDNPNIVAISYGDLTTRKPKIESGVIYSSGIAGSARGSGFLIDVSKLDNIYVSFDFECDSTENPSQFFTVDSVDTLNDAIYTGVSFYSIALGNKNGRVDVKISVAEYSAIALTFIATKQYGIAITNLMVSAEDVPYEPYWEGVRSAPVTEVVSESANLIPFPYVKTERTSNGVTFKALNDGRVSASGTCVNSIAYIELCDIKLNAGTYTILSGVKGSYDTFRFRLSPQTDGLNTQDVYTTNTITLDKEQTFKCLLIVSVGVTVDNLIFEPMIVKGEATPSQFTKGGVLDTFFIPYQVRALQGYGEANPDNPAEANYIDFEAQKFIAYGYMNDGVWVAHTSPVKTDISAYDNLIRVGGAGTLTFVNESGFAVPSTIVYQQEVSV
jgi:hypothetical protein